MMNVKEINSSLKGLSLELSLILLLTEDLYDKPRLRYPEEVDWGSFIRIGSQNKILHYALTKLLENARFQVKSEARNLLLRYKDDEDKELSKFQRTLEKIEAVLKDEDHLIINTFKNYAYRTHDVDLLVKDLKRTEKLLKSAGFSFLRELLPDIHYCKEGLLIVEIKDKITHGSLSVMDNEIIWTRDRKATIEDVEVRIPSAEVDFIHVITHTFFQFYKITLCDMLYIYRLAPRINWSFVATQAKKYRWFNSLYNTMSVLNYFHRSFYGKQSPMEKYFSAIRRVDLSLPYKYSPSEITRILAEKSLVNLVRLPSCFLDKVEGQSLGFDKVYSKIVMEKIGKPFVKYIYW